MPNLAEHIDGDGRLVEDALAALGRQANPLPVPRHELAWQDEGGRFRCSGPSWWEEQDECCDWIGYEREEAWARWWTATVG